MNYRYVDEDDADDVEGATIFEDIQFDGRTPLDKTIDRIGMGASPPTPFFFWTDARCSRELSVETFIALWFW